MSTVRYRVGEDPASAAPTGTDDVLLFTLILGFIIGLVLTWLGVRGRQIWLASWSAGLVVVSLATLGWIVAGGG